MPTAQSGARAGNHRGARGETKGTGVDRFAGVSRGKPSLPSRLNEFNTD
jgi:hypothetical protein